jgi:methyltransferase (TIGR00027 family)
MDRKEAAAPDHTAARVALWRALHVQVDSSPHVFEDEVGLKLVAPDENWRQRPDMHPQVTSGYRAAVVGRARFIEDLVQEQVQKGISQYVILGAGIDTFVQRKPELASQLRVFEIDKPDTQAWKRQRLLELGFDIPDSLRFVPVDFEAGDMWRQKLAMSGFDAHRRAVVASTGVSIYLTKEANLATLREVAAFAPGSTLAMNFVLPLDLLDPADRPLHERIYDGVKAAGTPFLSFFRPPEILALAREAGFRDAHHVSRGDLVQRYFAGRADGLQPWSGEEFLVATT